MRKILIGLAICGLASLSFAGDTYVSGYTKSNGTYVSGHYRSSSNGTTSDNWTTKGNTNPYTGKKGTKTPEPKKKYYGK
jgi:hypothetical protein